MSRLVLIEPEAEQEIRAARDWYEERREGLGADFVDCVDDAVKRIGEVPTASAPVPGVPEHLEVRRVFLKRFPYAAVFVEQDEAISVVALAHLKRRPGYWLQRVGKK